MYLLALLLTALTLPADGRGAPETRVAITAVTIRDTPPPVDGTSHIKGIVSLARGDDPASASTSLFIVTADAPSLDGKYTVFGQVIEGLEGLDRIEAAPVCGESPTTRIDLVKVRIAG